MKFPFLWALLHIKHGLAARRCRPVCRGTRAKIRHFVRADAPYFCASRGPLAALTCHARPSFRCASRWFKNFPSESFLGTAKKGSVGTFRCVELFRRNTSGLIPSESSRAGVGEGCGFSSIEAGFEPPKLPVPGATAMSKRVRRSVKNFPTESFGGEKCSDGTFPHKGATELPGGGGLKIDRCVRGAATTCAVHARPA